jgi:nucleotide-binding universal stress UspA family protein
MPATLLVLTDFSQAANRTLDYATSLAVALRARLVLLHVQRDSLLDAEALGDDIAVLTTSAARLALDSLVRNSPVPTVAEVAHGRVLPAVTQAIERLQPALVVLGRPDCDELPDELANTTALQLLQHAPYPMLVVPPTLTPAARPRRLMLAADGDAFTLGNYAGVARRLLGLLRAKLTVVHCAPYVKLGDSALESVQQTGLLLDLPRPCTLQLVATDPAEGILSVAQPTDCDGVVMLARRRSRLSSLFHRSVTARVLLHSQVPVLVLPTQ